MISKKINKYKYYIITVLFALSSFMLKIKADSGFDSSFDSGSSGSDWGGSSDWSSSSSGGSSRPMTLQEILTFFYSIVQIIVYIVLTSALSKTKHKKLFLILYIIISSTIEIILLGFNFVTFFMLVMLIISNTSSNNNKNKTTINYFNENEFSSLNTKELQEELYGIYKDIQEAWSNNDIEPVRNLLTDELFNTYQFQIDSMFATKQRNAMTDFNFVRMSIKNLSIVNGTEELKVVMEVTCRDYMVENKNGKEIVVRGNSNIINDYIYEMTFVRSAIRDIKYCPNCGAELTGGMSSKCQYCNGIIIHGTDKYVLSKKQMLKQSTK